MDRSQDPSVTGQCLLCIEERERLGRLRFGKAIGVGDDEYGIVIHQRHSGWCRANGNGSNKRVRWVCQQPRGAE